MIALGLIGYPLSHSFSEGYFREKFAQLGLSDTFQYKAYPLAEIEEVQDLFNDPNLLGFNITIPYKEAIIPYLDELSPAAKVIGAVNTVHIKGGRGYGHNTDVIGFGDTLDVFLAEHGGVSNGALILGTGGAAKAIAWVLEQRQIPFHFVSRREGENRLSYQQLTAMHFANSDLIVNTTPLGTYPSVDNCPDIPYHCLSKRHRLYDLVYNPPETLFLQGGKSQGAAIHNGVAMLHGPAEASWEIWTADTKNP